MITLGKASREQRRLMEQAVIAQDISALASRPFQVSGVEVAPATIRTSMGPVQGATITIHMADGKQLTPFTLDPIGIIALIAGTSAVLAGAGQGGPRPEPHGDPSDPASLASTDQEPTITPSGLIIP